MVNVTTNLLNDAIKIFLTKRGFYDYPLDEMKQRMGAIAFEAFNTLEDARLKVQILSFNEEE